MTRTEYARELAAALSEDECKTMFDVSREALEEGFVNWNQALEVAYQEFIQDAEFFDWLFDDIAEELSQDMPCDRTGFCSPSCPQYQTCRG